MPSQDTRVARITVPAIADPETIGLVRYDITEGISELFEWRVENVAEKSLPVDKLLSEPCAIKHKSYTTERDFHARIIDVQNAGIRGNYRIYNLVMRPWLWLLSRTTNCQIFENKNVREIIEGVATIDES
ncbi:MAG: hypothetical protein J0H62_09400, partial [Rhizobiales bacterium]|nr:hypothetical protein [Hyphomicrobiales bacterium]